MPECEEYESQVRKKELEEKERQAKLEEEKKKRYEDIQIKSEELDEIANAHS